MFSSVQNNFAEGGGSSEYHGQDEQQATIQAYQSNTRQDDVVPGRRVGYQDWLYSNRVTALHIVYYRDLKHWAIHLALGHTGCYFAIFVRADGQGYTNDDMCTYRGVVNYQDLGGFKDDDKYWLIDWEVPTDDKGDAMYWLIDPNNEDQNNLAIKQILTREGAALSEFIDIIEQVNTLAEYELSPTRGCAEWTKDVLSNFAEAGLLSGPQKQEALESIDAFQEWAAQHWASYGESQTCRMNRAERLRNRFDTDSD
jgi:hypothetical protein